MGVLMDFMRRIGFSQNWIEWVKHCRLIWIFLVLINGSLTLFFSTQKGLSQRGPLSPFIYLITMECLDSMFKTSNINGYLRGFDVARIGQKSPKITHL